MHPLIRSCSWEFRPEAATRHSRIGLGGQEPGGLVVGLSRCRHLREAVLRAVNLGDDATPRSNLRTIGGRILGRIEHSVSVAGCGRA